MTKKAAHPPPPTHQARWNSIHTLVGGALGVRAAGSVGSRSARAGGQRCIPGGVYVQTNRYTRRVGGNRPNRIDHESNPFRKHIPRRSCEGCDFDLEWRIQEPGLKVQDACLGSSYLVKVLCRTVAGTRCTTACVVPTTTRSAGLCAWRATVTCLRHVPLCS